MKLLQHKQTGFYRIVGLYGSSGGFPTKSQALNDYKRIKRNAIEKEKREIISDMCGTSYSSAMRDMGRGY